MEKPNRHRFVRLKDLVEYQAKRREQTRVVLEQMVADAEDSGEPHDLVTPVDALLVRGDLCHAQRAR